MIEGAENKIPEKSDDIALVSPADIVKEFQIELSMGMLALATIGASGVYGKASDELFGKPVGIIRTILELLGYYPIPDAIKEHFQERCLGAFNLHIKT